MKKLFRLTSPMFQRSDENLQIPPERVVFLSVEGSTERDYLSNINHYREDLGIRSVVYLEVLGKDDTESSTDQVFALLEEYMAIREQGILPDKLKKALDTNSYDEDFIQAYINDDEQISKDDKEKFTRVLQEIKFDIAYSKYLSKIQSNDDYFGVVVDRDCGNHSVEQMKRLIELCAKSGEKCICFITNPCFELWLLLHLDGGLEFIQEHKEDVLLNKKTGKHTFVSRKVATEAHHNKHITKPKFNEMYKSKIEYAIECANQFESDPDRLIDKIGTNLPVLFEILRSEMK